MKKKYGKRKDINRQRKYRHNGKKRENTYFFTSYEFPSIFTDENTGKGKDRKREKRTEEREKNE